ncbi:hypothetical protein Tco_0823223 [Tanacetum coccineum]|uniref:Uncharacterized protein n=1 Tax=Tanacetum coccineum TaxID=301880 RepID=A0ABQ5ALW3_9ASTR
MNDPNITMEEYIRLKEEKAQRHGRTFNWQTATYDKMEHCEDEDNSFTNFRTEYPTIVFDDTLTSDATLSCEPTVNPLNENKIDFRISFDKSDDEDYMVIFNENSFSYKIIFVDNLKTDSEKENDKVNMPSSPEPTISHSDDLDFFKDFENEFPAVTYNDDLTSKLTKPSDERYRDGFRHEEMAEDGFGAYWLGSERVIPDKGDLREYWIEISSDRDLLGPTPSYVFIRYPVRRLCHKMISCSISGRGQTTKKVTGVDLFYLMSMDWGTANVPYLLAQYLFRHAEGRKSVAKLSEGHFIRRLTNHFRLVSDQGLRGLSMVTRELPLIDLHELGRLNIYERIGYTWAWIAPGPERQPDAAVGAPGATEDAPVVDGGAQADPAPVQAPQPPPLAPKTMP